MKLASVLITKLSTLGIHMRVFCVIIKKLHTFKIVTFLAGIILCPIKKMYKSISDFPRIMILQKKPILMRLNAVQGISCPVVTSLTMLGGQVKCYLSGREEPAPEDLPPEEGEEDHRDEQNPLPLVDRYEQRAWRRKVFFENVHKA